MLQTDRISSKRESHIGTIEVVRYQSSYVKQEYRKTSDTVFNQATKKDAYKVTAGKYTMSTTRKGKLIHQVKPYDVQLKKLWRIGRECGKLTVQYRMGHTLQGMGIELRPTDWTKIVSRKVSEDRSSSTSSVELQGSPAQSPAQSPVTSTDHLPQSSPTSSAEPCKELTPPPPSQISPSVLSTSPVHPHLAQNGAGIQFLIMPVKIEPDDIKTDITSLQNCVPTKSV